MLKILPCLDSEQMAEARRKELDIPRPRAEEFGRSAVEACSNGYYLYRENVRVDLSRHVENARLSKVSIPPDLTLASIEHPSFSETRVQVTNETTLGASRRLVESGLRPLALNFANGIHPGGGFLHGARAQEEVLCRSSALYLTLAGDPMYAEHRKRQRPDSTDWAIYSPDVPVFRNDDGSALERPWLLSFITCAAPYAPRVGQQESAELLRSRIHRVFAIALAYGHSALVLGAWGCGAFRNDPHQTAIDFREALQNEFDGAFSYIVFAITDWSAERKFLRPFKVLFSPSN